METYIYVLSAHLCNDTLKGDIAANDQSCPGLGRWRGGHWALGPEGPGKVYISQQMKNKNDLVVNIQKMGALTLNIQSSAFLESSSLKHWDFLGLAWDQLAGHEKWHPACKDTHHTLSERRDACLVLQC